METVELRNKLIQLINTVDEDYLRDMFAFIEQKNADKKSDIVAYTVQGKPLTKEMYIKKVKDAEVAMDAGQFVTSEELEKQMRSW